MKLNGLSASNRIIFLCLFAFAQPVYSLSENVNSQQPDSLIVTNSNTLDTESAVQPSGLTTVSTTQPKEAQETAQIAPSYNRMKSPFISEQSPGVISPQPIGFSDFFSAFIALLFVVMMIFGLAWFGRRTGLVSSSDKKIIKVIDATSIGYKEKLALVEVGEEQVLIGITSSRIEKLMVLEHPVRLDPDQSSNLITKAAPSFLKAFNQVKNKPSKEKSDS